MLIDKNINKGDLKRAAGISVSSVSKLAADENIQSDILLKICNALNCDFSHIMEVGKRGSESKD
jgi:DNA-binding Xre family transcriptional regulator